jgi:hypothetical protein
MEPYAISPIPRFPALPRLTFLSQAYLLKH